MKRLPLGIQTISEIITNKYLYIDKTKSITALIQEGKYFFLSRPRRFGKSLLISTLKEIFEGNRVLFKGLYIYDKIAWETHPVIHIDFSVIAHTNDEVLTTALRLFFDKIALKHGITLTGSAVSDIFNDLVEKLHDMYNQKVVVLVDEYDKPILDVVTDLAIAKKNRNILRDIFSVLKGADQYLKFVFMTGVSKFSKVSIFSGLNNIKDITLSADFSTLLGITDDELRTAFSDRLEKLADKEHLPVDALLDKIRRWYNGYSWDGVKRVYNPTSLLNLFFDNKFDNYWFATGTPTFLIEMMRKNNYEIPEIEQTQVGANIIDSYDIDYVDINSLLLQTGYLTIKSIEKIDEEYLYTLAYPNHEVKDSLLHYIIAHFTGNPISKIKPLHIQLKQALRKKDLQRFLTILTSLFAGIPYNLQVKNESYYHSLCYMVLALMGVTINLEVLSDKGRVDGVLTLENCIYIIEFKLGTAKAAMKQIKESKYYQPFLNKGKEVLLLGIGGFAKKELEYCLEEAPAH